MDNALIAMWVGLGSLGLVGALCWAATTPKQRAQFRREMKDQRDAKELARRAALARDRQVLRGLVTHLANFDWAAGAICAGLVILATGLVIPKWKFCTWSDDLCNLRSNGYIAAAGAAISSVGLFFRIRGRQT